jgi:sec-independent protein translocase protein TatA
MLGLHTPELLVILAVTLIIFGPKNLPRLGSMMGKGVKELRQAADDIVDNDKDPEDVDA